ncbi:nucleoside deaminase [Amycolatopsis magusensis]|uniref:tRNA(Arg) A34 adenosine deaminase TadA n=1 Tax=Amycolatopsis magusensis TaxID=882444 RepID=A0ABS4PZT4_9PSEU|nr:nucleoside deaminase [Amycolatopsis magusensis]MBP2184936.1 tRNA(Arg) A34 adenosine deaminase TadA [Amycolatopsis magusensis]MDI5982381.1 nucleoside deaminase [Amycolatopsis magusensis]
MTTTESREAAWLTECVRLAAKNVTEGGGPFGALIVRDGETIATGVNRVTPDLDPTAHAEVVAIRAACRALGTFKLDGCVLVSSCEPCPMCLSSALWARVDRIVYAADRHDAAKAGFDDLAFYELFSTPRDAWSVPVTQVSTEDGFTPFATWLDQPDRVDY